MKHQVNRYRTVYLLPIILLQIHATYSMPSIPQNFFKYNQRYPIGYSFEESAAKAFDEDLDEDTDSKFVRKAKSDKQSHMFSVDISRLRKDTPLLTPLHHRGHKPPVNLVGIDISVLSRNPDPTLPIITKLPKDKMNGKFIMGYDFDSFDRLPVIKTKPMHTYSSIQPKPREIAKENTLLPMMFVPLHAMTTSHSILGDKKYNLNGPERYFRDDENEQRYTADFILRLLYQLSSNYKKVMGN